MFWSPPVATLASRWSTFLSSRVSFSLRTLSRDLQRIVQLYCYLLIKTEHERKPAAHVEAVEEVRDPLDAAGDELDVLPVDPVRLRLPLQTLPVGLGGR